MPRPYARPAHRLDRAIPYQLLGRTPGTTSTGTPASPAGGDLLAAPAEHKRVAALEPDHPAAGLRVLDQQPR